RFVPDPFSCRRAARLYRTGDVGRRREDGAIEYLGRADRHAIVRGARIDASDVEAALWSHVDVADVAVVPRETPRGWELVAYVAPQRGRTVDNVTLTPFLKRLLPLEWV